MADVSPGLILILGALVVPLLRGHLRSVWLVALPLLALLHLVSLPMGEAGQFELMGLTLTTLRVDELSLAFGCVFLVAILLGMIYALHVEDTVQHVAALLYAGSAVGAVFAGDLVTLFVFWDVTAVASVFLVWASRTEGAFWAGMRYLFLQMLSGLLLLEGLLLLYHDTGSIAFDAIATDTKAGWLVLGAFAINCAFPLVHTWLTESYAKATVTGSVILSAFTTNLAVYALARGFAGLDILIPVGVVMVLFPLVHALLERDLRRTLAYVMVSQLGFMVIGVGLGGEMAIAGVAAQAVAHILYNSLLFMAVGAALYRVGTADAAGLGGLRRSMPKSAALAAFGAAAIGLPMLCGFVGKALIVSAVAAEGRTLIWGVLVFGGAAAFLLAGLKVVYLAYYAPDTGRKVAEAPANMLLAMGLTAVLCLVVGLFPGSLFAMLPGAVDYNPYTPGNVAVQLAGLAVAAIAFLLLLRSGFFTSRLRADVPDVDRIYRGPGLQAVRSAFETARTWRAGALGLMGARVRATVARLYRTHGPEGILARDWPTGAMAFWTTVLLAVWLLAYYV